MATARKARKPRKRRPPKAKAARKAKVRRAVSSQYRSHRGASAAKLFRAHKGRHHATFKAHATKRGLAVQHVSHPKAPKPKAVKVKAVKPKVTHPKAAKRVVHHKTATHHTIASHRCGQPLTHTTRKATAKAAAAPKPAKTRHLTKAEKAKISKSLTGKHATCACKTAGAKKTKARAHTAVHRAHKESAKTRAKISSRLRSEHVGTKWGKAAKGSHRGATKHESVLVRKAAKRSSGRAKAAAKRPC